MNIAKARAVRLFDRRVVAQKGGSFCLQIRINGRLAPAGLLAEKLAATGAGSEKSGLGPQTRAQRPVEKPRQTD